MTLPMSPHTLRLAAICLDRFVESKGPNLASGEQSELLELADMMRAVARREADLLLTAFKESPDGSPGDLAGVEHGGRRPSGAPPADPSYPSDPDGGLARAAAAEWTDARLYAEGMEPFAHGEGNLR